MDIVIPFVDNTDPVWQQEFNKISHTKVEEASVNRYRDWGFLKYIFRSIEKHIPFVDNVFLILSGPSQIPKWLKTDNSKLKIIYHEEYIPEKYLPTFNANTIECFLWRIPELGEYFLYMNDDIFFNKDLNINHYVKDGKLANDIFYKQMPDDAKYYHRMWNNDLKYGTLFNDNRDDVYVNTNHGINVFSKSSMRRLFEIHGDSLLDTFTQIRDVKNITQLCFQVYEKTIGNTFKKDITCCYYKLKNNDISANEVLAKLKKYDTFCLNDLNWYDDFDKIRSIFLSVLDTLFPSPSKFETYNESVSIVLTTYNNESTIKRALLSILNQTYDNFECIIVNDGSDDNTLDIIKDTIQYDKRFKIINNDTKLGPGASKQIGLNNCSNEYICFSDGDDINDDKKIENLMDYFFMHPNDKIAIGKMVKVGKSGNKLWCLHKKSSYYIHELNKGDNLLYHLPKCMIKKSCCKGIVFPNIYISEDVIFLANYIYNNCITKINVIDDIVYYYIDNPSSITKNKRTFLQHVNDTLSLLKYMMTSSIAIIKYTCERNYNDLQKKLILLNNAK